MELLVKLGINWQLLIAQIVNFLIVLGVLGYFLYKPILALLDARTERIRKAMEDAKHIENQMKEMEQLRFEEMKKIDAESGAYFERMRKQAETMQEEILKGAKKEADSILQSASRRIEDERRSMMEEVLKTVNKVVIAMTEKLLEREFTSADQERIAKQLVAELPKTMR
ncbi:MAG: F0F1 ATP synthase subunit B [Candidatus Peribacteraceae bacterium]|nr:F0F1 ATP synthase subunit B [Candidatus Peribacteraceae bacterium]